MTDTQNGSKGNRRAAGAVAVLQARAERGLIRQGGSFRHIDFGVKVSAAPAPDRAERRSLALALVIDRSGSMQGSKLATAKRAALAVVDQLDDRDQVAVVVFDDQIEVLQAAALVTRALQERLRSALAAVEARASTALHEGWLTGCRELAVDHTTAGADRLARCFLLTDGLANVGLIDPEQIASEAAAVREQAGVGTSSFGIGDDYDEALLGPLAVAGGGQFHHLRRPEEIAKTFIGELGGLLAVALSSVRLEMQTDADVRVEVISQYWLQPAKNGRSQHIAIGDLLGGEERHVVVRFGFPPGQEPGSRCVRARLLWSAVGAEQSTRWQEIRFAYADGVACDAEPRDPRVMHWVGLHHAARAEQEAAEMNRRGDFEGARQRVRRVAQRIREYAGDDAELQAVAGELESLERPLGAAMMAAPVAKELRYQSQRRSRAQPDYRGEPPEKC